MGVLVFWVDWRASRWARRKADAFIQSVYSGRKGQMVVRTRSRDAGCNTRRERVHQPRGPNQTKGEIP